MEYTEGNLIMRFWISYHSKSDDANLITRVLTVCHVKLLIFDRCRPHYETFGYYYQLCDITLI